MQKITAMKILLLLVLPFAAFAQNPFDLLGQSRASVETVIGKPIATDYASTDNGKTVTQIAYKLGDYHIGYVNDTARSFTYKPKDFITVTDGNLAMYPSVKLTVAERQNDPARTLYFAASSRQKLFVETSNTSKKIMKISYLPVPF